MSRMNGQVKVDRGRMVWEHMGRPNVEHAAEVWRLCMQEAGIDTDESG